MATERAETDVFGKTLYKQAEASDKEIVGNVQKIAEAHGVPLAQIALAWMLTKSVVTSPIVGATKMHHLEDAVAALNVHLTDEEIAALESAYTPRFVAGFS